MMTSSLGRVLTAPASPVTQRKKGTEGKKTGASNLFIVVKKKNR
jgi:hypothetical protein